MTKIGQYVFGDEEDGKVYVASVYEPGTVPREGFPAGTPNGDGYLHLVPRDEADIPYVVGTTQGNYWIKAEYQPNVPLVEWPDEDPWDKDSGTWRSDSGTDIKRVVSNGGYGGGWAFEMDLEHTSAFWTFPQYSYAPLPERGESWGVWWRHMNWASNRQFWIYVCQQAETQIDPNTYRIEHRPGDLIIRHSASGDVLDVESVSYTDGKWYFGHTEFHEGDGFTYTVGDENGPIASVSTTDGRLDPYGLGFRGNPNGHYYIDVPTKYPPDTDFSWDNSLPRYD